MSLHRRILAALIALAFLSLAPVHGAATLDRAMCSVADRAAGNPATCEGSEGVDSANQELSKLYDGSVLVATVGGSANAITGSTTPSAPALVDGMMRQIKPIVSNTGAATYNDNGLGAKQLVASNGAALSSGDLQTTTVYLMRYYAANDEWRVLTPLGTGVASASNAYVTVGNTGSLSAERAITPDGSTLEGIDGGANSTYTIREKDNGTTNAKLATMAAGTIKCNATGATANPTDCTASTSKTLLAITGADVANTPAGNIAATTAQAALNELDTEKQVADADLSALSGNSTAGLWAYTGAGTGAARTLTAPAAGLAITNPAGTAGNPTFALANDLAAVEGLGSTGLAARTAADTWAQRTITGTSNEITITNGDGVLGNPTVSLPSALTFTGKTVTGGTFSGPAITTPGAGLTLNGNTSGSTTLAATATASGALTLPAATDTLVGKATTDTLTNKSMSGASNTFTNLPNSALTNPATTVNSQTCTLGSTCTVTVPVATGVTGLGTGVATALTVNVGSAGAPVVNGGAGGTPSSITLTNGTGLPTTGLSGTLQAAQFPALTGECTTSAGSLSTTCVGGTVDAGADPALGADQGRFTSNATVPGNLVFEGDTADSFETRFDITDPTADRTVKIPNANTVTVQGTACGGTDKVSGIDATTGAITCSADAGGAGAGTPVAINGSSSANLNINGTTPAAPAGSANVTWQVSAGSPDQASAYVTAGKNLAVSSGALVESVTSNIMGAVVTSTATDTQNDFSPTNWDGSEPSKGTIIEWNGASPMLLTSLAGGTAGRLAVVRNRSSEQVIVVQYEASTGTAANRFQFDLAGGRAHLIILPGDTFTFLYDAAASRWKLTGPVPDIAQRLGWQRTAQVPGTGTAPISLGIAHTTASAGTLSTPGISFTNYHTFMRRTNCVTGASAGVLCGTRHGLYTVSRGSAAGIGGFVAHYIWGFSVLPASAETWFVGLYNSTAAPANANMSANTNAIGWGRDPADAANVQAVGNDSTGTGTKVNLGASFPENTTVVYDGYIFAIPNGTGVTQILWRKDDMTIAPDVRFNSTSADLPANNLGLAHYAYIGNRAAAASYGLDWMLVEELRPN